MQDEYQKFLNGLEKRKVCQWYVDGIHNGENMAMLMIYCYKPDSKIDGAYVTITQDAKINAGFFKDAIMNIGDADFTPNLAFQYDGTFEEIVQEMKDYVASTGI